VFRTQGTKPDQNSVYYYVGIDDARFKKPVVPGDQLEIEVNFERQCAASASSRARPASRASSSPRRPSCARSGDLGRMPAIHPTAIVHDGAQLAAEVAVGPVLDRRPAVELGEGTWIGAHVVLDGRARIGRRNRIFHFASIGAPPQDKKYAGEDTAVEIGDGNVIREYVTINRGTRSTRA